jgi:hypothetical protein
MKISIRKDVRRVVHFVRLVRLIKIIVSNVVLMLTNPSLIKTSASLFAPKVFMENN